MPNMSNNLDNKSLIDLSEQFPFKIDENVKNQICFNETLIISCVHGDGDFVSESKESLWSCTEQTENEFKVDKEFNESHPKFVAEEESHIGIETEKEEEDFHFYFFPDCTKTVVQDSEASLLLENGMPVINKKNTKYVLCTCAANKDGICPCHIKLPCDCGAKTVAECRCNQLENICICDERNPQPLCKCKPKNVCCCYPDGSPRPFCDCNKIDKPCVCKTGKFPSPICLCNNETSKDLINKKTSHKYGEETMSNTTVDSNTSKEICTCQKLTKKTCLCIKGKECTCIENECICGVQLSCVCDPSVDEEYLCKEDESKSVCACPITPACTCNAESTTNCKCFPQTMECSCGNPEDCKCFVTCECTEPCICDTAPKIDFCTCTENRIKTDTSLCTCAPKDKDIQILKRTRAGRDGYRWCHAVDPKHTFFDYAYDRNDKVNQKEQENEKLKILGLHSDSQINEKCEIHKMNVPTFKKTVRKPTLDCCSAVGGINISVDTLGDNKDKFLVQVVSHSSKNGAKCGTKLVSILDCNLHTLEENRIEYITKKDITKERRSYAAICDSGYYNKVTRVCGERHFVKRIYHSFEDAHNFLLEGANVVLLRYFGLSRYRGHVKTDTVLIDGVICESVYVSLGVSQAIVNGSPLFIVKVERHIIEPTGFIHQTLTALTLRGYIVSHEWADNSYIFHVNPLLRVIPEKDEIEQHQPLREHWRSDLQLLSDYLDFKRSRCSEGARYVSESGELSGVIRDYLQTLLLLRPHDALHFTHHYFGAALSELDLPHNEFFEPTKKNVRYYFFEE